LEAVLLSITPSFIRRQKDANPIIHASLLTFKEDIDRPLSAILTLNTIAHTVGAIGVGAQAGALFGDNDLSVGGFALNAESLIATFMTLAILILSEIIPKTIGANNWKALTPFTISTLNFLLKVLGPFVWLSQKITKGLKKEKGKSVLNRADILAMTDAASKEGNLDKSESKVIQNVLNLPNITVHDIMTPRKVMYTAIESETLEELVSEDGFKHFSRIPVYEESKEDITGVVLKNEVLTLLVEGKKETKLSEIKREIGEVQEDELLANFFNKDFNNKEHMHVVKDKYGSVTGLVTMEDVLETILGYEIMDETDKVEDMQSLL
jgi:CBS domain containing-hemolysin-like protein